MNDAGTRVEIATDRSNRKLLIQPPNPLRHNSGAVATDVDGGSDFEGWIIWAIKIHKHLHRDASFLSAQKGRVCQRFSFEPGGPTVAILPLRPLEAMVLRGNGPSGNQGQT